MEIQPFSLRESIEESLELLAPSATEKRLDLAYRIGNDVPIFLRGDVTRLRQILTNLLNNAIKFTERGEVVVGVSLESSAPRPEKSVWKRSEERAESGDRNSESIAQSAERYAPSTARHAVLHFAVKDTGIGIPKDRMDRLFKSFSQVDASTSRQYGGTGLGLVISKRLSELMGGTMWVESEAGKGSTFHFTIIAEVVSIFNAPAVETKRVDSHRQKLNESSSEQLPLRILLVEDNQVNQKLASRFLQKLGYRTDVAANGLEALEAVERQTYDVVLMDVQMPEMDGLEATRRLRARDDMPQQPRIIAMTANAMQGDREICLAAGMDDYISKPVQLDELIKALNKYASLDK